MSWNLLFASNFALNPQRLACLCLSSAWIKGVYHYVRSCNKILYFYLKIFSSHLSMTHKSPLELTYIFFFIFSYIWWAFFFFFWFLCSTKCFYSWVHTSCLTGLWLLLLFPRFYSPIYVSPASDIFLLFAFLFSYILVYFREILIRSFLCSGNWTKSWIFKQVLYHGEPSPAPYPVFQI